MSGPAKQLRSLIVGVLFCVALLAGLQIVGHRVGDQLRDYGARGREVALRVHEVEQGRGEPYARVTYVVDGREREWSVTVDEGTHPGDTVTGYYLPEDPDRVRTGVGEDAAREAERPFSILSLFVLLVLAFVVIVKTRGQAAAPPLVGGMLVVALIVSLVDPSVAAFAADAFGERACMFVAIAFALFAPGLYVLGDGLTRVALAHDARSRGAFLAVLLRGDVEPAVRRHRRRARLALAYLVALMLAWIAVAERLGI